MDENTKKYKRRSDYGNIKITDRDMQMMMWIAEQYAIRQDHLQVLASRLSEYKAEGELISEAAVKQIIYTRWAKAGWIEKQKVFASKPIWLWPSRKGLADFGLEYQYNKPSAGTLKHIWYANHVRLSVEAPREKEDRTKPLYVWTGERQIARDREREAHRVDAEFRYPSGRLDAIEVELTQKSQKKLKPIMSWLVQQKRYTKIIYFSPPEIFDAMDRAIKRMGFSSRVKIEKIEVRP